MSKLSDTDQERVNETFTEGTKNFTDADFEDVFAKEEKANKKAQKLGGFFGEFKLLWELMKDAKDGLYDVSFSLMAAIGFAMAYLILPIDIIPDFIPALGFTDDLATFAIVMSQFKSEIDKYKEWKKNN